MTTLRQILQPECVLIQADVADKQAALQTIAARLSSFYQKSSPEAIFAKLQARENLSPTTIGYGLTIPHFRCHLLSEPVACVLLCPNGFDDQAPDKTPVQLVITLAVPEANTRIHLQLLSQIVRQLQHTQHRQRCVEAKTPDELYQLLTQHVNQAAYETA